MKRSAPHLSVIVPVFNEAGGLEHFYRELRAVLEETRTSYELLFIDDGSVDHTWDIAEKLYATDSRIRLFRLSRNFGKESAMRVGLEHARGEAVILMDADLQHPPELIATMIRYWRAGTAVVEAVKASRGTETALSRFGARAFYSLLERLSGLSLAGSTDFKLLDRSVVNALLEMEESTTFFRGATTWAGFDRVQIPFDVKPAEGRSSRWSLSGLGKLFVTGIASFSSAPLQLVSLVGLGFFLFALALGVQTVFNYLTGTAVSGFTTVILLQLLIGSAVLMGLGVIGIYLSTIYHEVKRRPRYILREKRERALWRDSRSAEPL